MAPLKITVDDIMNELTFSQFITRRQELKKITKSCKKLLEAQCKKTSNRQIQIQHTHDFIREIWKKYDCLDVAEIYTNFIKIEEALYGLERDESLGKRYRDHFVHMVNCYIFGLRIISYLAKNIPEPIFKDIFKVENENLLQIGLPFGDNYTYKQRVFYLWTLIATFHDIAIPFQHLTGIGKGIDDFIKEFGWKFRDAKITMRDYDSSQLYYYFNLLSSIYGGNLEFIEDGKKYKRLEKTNYYLSKILGRAFDIKDHGVLSGFFMWKTIEEIFLIGRSDKYQFNIDEFNTYAEYVLEQDIARAALSISLHNIAEEPKTKVYPKIFPIRFKTLPLTFLLILSDELQEYLRWEGISLIKEMKFQYHPFLDIQFYKSNNSIRVKVEFAVNSQNEANIIKQAMGIAKHQKIEKDIKQLGDAINLIGDSLKGNLEKKLLIGKEFKLRLNILIDGKRKVFSKEIRSDKN